MWLENEFNWLWWSKIIISYIYKMSNKIEKNDTWDDLTDSQKNEIQQEVNE